MGTMIRAKGLGGLAIREVVAGIALATLAAPSIADASAPPSAGYYSVAFSTDGTFTSNAQNPPPPPYTVPYTSGAGSCGGGGATGGGTAGPPATAGPGTGKCQGQITAVLTWVQGSDRAGPPSCVIVCQTCVATWTGDSGDCANSLGDPAMPNFQQTRPRQPAEWTRTAIR